MTPPAWHQYAARTLEREQRRDRRESPEARLARELLTALSMGPLGPAYYAAAKEIAEADDDR